LRRDLGEVIDVLTVELTSFQFDRSVNRCETQVIVSKSVSLAV